MAGTATVDPDRDDLAGGCTGPTPDGRFDAGAADVQDPDPVSRREIGALERGGHGRFGPRHPGDLCTDRKPPGEMAFDGRPAAAREVDGVHQRQPGRRGGLHQAYQRGDLPGDQLCTGQRITADDDRNRVVHPREDVGDQQVAVAPPAPCAPEPPARLGDPQVGRELARLRPLDQLRSRRRPVAVDRHPEVGLSSSTTSSVVTRVEVRSADPAVATVPSDLLTHDVAIGFVRAPRPAEAGASPATLSTITSATTSAIAPLPMLASPVVRPASTTIATHRHTRSSAV